MGRPSSRYSEFRNRDRRRSERDPATARRDEALRRLKRRLVDEKLVQYPVDLEDLAERVGVKEIRFVPLSIRGRLIREGNRLCAEINRTLAGFDRRFTLAHELSHLILEPDRLDCVSGSSKGPSLPAGHIEMLCDACATELLTPEEWLRSKLKNRPTGLEAARQVALEIGAPLEFVAQRAMELGLWRGRILIWEVNPRAGGFSVTETYPPVDQASLIRIGAVGANSLIGESLLNRELIRGTLTLDLDGPVWEYRADAVAIGPKRALSLLLFE